MGEQGKTTAWQRSTFRSTCCKCVCIDVRCVSASATSVRDWRVWASFCLSLLCFKDLIFPWQVFQIYMNHVKSSSTVRLTVFWKEILQNISMGILNTVFLLRFSPFICRHLACSSIIFSGTHNNSSIKWNICNFSKISENLSLTEFVLCSFATLKLFSIFLDFPKHFFLLSH